MDIMIGMDRCYILNGTKIEMTEKVLKNGKKTEWNAFAKAIGTQLVRVPITVWNYGVGTYLFELARRCAVFIEFVNFPSCIFLFFFIKLLASEKFVCLCSKKSNIIGK